MEEKTVPDWLIPNRLYDILKWVGLIVCPALAVFVQTIGPAWGFADTSAGALIGVLIGASALKGAAND